MINAVGENETRKENRKCRYECKRFYSIKSEGQGRSSERTVFESRPERGEFLNKYLNQGYLINHLHKLS